MTITIPYLPTDTVTDGTLRDFPIDFPFTDASQIRVLHTPAGATASSELAGFTVVPGDIDADGRPVPDEGGTARFPAGAEPAAGTVTTALAVPLTQNVPFRDLTDVDLAAIERAFDRQLLATAQREGSFARALARPGAGPQTPFDGGGFRIVNLADPVDPQDAATAAWVNASYNSGFDAGQAKLDAEAARDAAQSAETGAQTAEANAQISETNAAASATGASASETNAATSAAAAAASETNAATSAAAAGASETNAGTSEANAATSEANAAQFAASINLPDTPADQDMLLYDAAASGYLGKSANQVLSHLLGGKIKIHQIVEDKNNAIRTLGTSTSRLSEALVSVTPSSPNTKLMVIGSVYVFAENSSANNAFVYAAGGYYDGTKYARAPGVYEVPMGGQALGANGYQSRHNFTVAYILTQSELRSDANPGRWLAAMVGRESSGDVGEARGSIMIGIEYEVIQ